MAETVEMNQEIDNNSIPDFIDGMLNKVVNDAVKSAKNEINIEKATYSSHTVDELRMALLKSEENNSKLMSKNISLNKNYIQLSQENTLLKSKIFQLSNEIINLEGQVQNLKKQIETKNKLVEKQGIEIDDWQIKSTKIERIYENKLKQMSETFKNAPVELNNGAENQNTAKEKIDECMQENHTPEIQATQGDVKQSIVANEMKNEIVQSEEIQNKNLNPNGVLNAESPIEDVTQYKAMVNRISKHYLESRNQLVKDYDNLIAELKCLKIETPSDDMNVIYAKKVEEKLIKFLNEKILMDKTIIDLQQDKIALEEHIVDCKDVWHKEEKRLQDKIGYLENTVRKYSRINNKYSDSKDPLSDSGKIVYLRQLVLQLLLTKDWTIKHGMLMALQKLLDLTDEEVHTLRHSL